MASNGNVIIWCAPSALRRSVQHFLRENAYTVVSCMHADDVRIALSIEDYILLITDLPFPDETLQLLLKRYPKLPVLHIVERMPDVKAAPPHYVCRKPFNIEEIGKLLRQKKPSYESLLLGKYTILPEKNAILYKHTETNIPKKEMELLLLLYRNRPDMVSKEQIARRLWPQEPRDRDNSISVYANNLRKYFLKDDGIRFISVYGKGLCLESE